MAGTLSKINRIKGSQVDFDIDMIEFDTGHGTLPSNCPDCKGPLDFGPIGGDELVCRNKCGYRFVNSLVQE